MTIEEMDLIGEKLNDLMLPLLLPVRIKKNVDEEVFQKVEALLNELKLSVIDNKEISRKLVGTLYFIYASLKTEEYYCNDEGNLRCKIGVLESYLDVIFDSPEL